MKRREFFSSFLKRGEKSLTLHPPYHQNDFSACLECESIDCVKACEEEIIQIQEGVPVLNFTSSGCTFCDECAKACKKGVLKVEFKTTLPPPKIAVLSCLAWNKTICNLCKEVCLDRAIEFVGLFNPQIDDKLCSGCGFCVGVCPTQAIRWEG